MASSPITLQQTDGAKVETMTDFIFFSFFFFLIFFFFFLRKGERKGHADARVPSSLPPDFIFLGSRIIVDGDCNHESKRRLLLGRQAMTNPDSVFKKQRRHFANKGLYSQSYGFPNSHVRTWELDHKEGWVLKNWCFWIVVQKTLQSPLDSRDTKPVNPKGNQHWIFTEGLMLKLQYFGPLMQKNRLIEKDLEAEKDWGQEEKAVTEDKMVGWYYQLNGHEFDQTPGNNEGQRSLACCSPWGCRVGHGLVTEQWTRVRWVHEQGQAAEGLH